MKRFYKFLIFAVIFFAFQMSANAQDLSVFGMKLGGAFTIPECNLVLKEAQYLNEYGGLMGKLTKKKYWQYKYDPNITSQCFKRPDLEKIEFKKKEEIPALPLPKPQAFVTVVSPENAKPALTADGDFYAYILSDGNLDGVIFKINKNESNAVFETLKQKYGNNVKVTPMKWQNSTGAVYDYYIADWSMPKLTIKFQSAGIFFRIDSFDPITRMVAAESDNAFASPYGMVSIGQKGQEAPPPSKIPL